tara:strand:+ start:955 stop:2190 length:1236 start_codon:yes stop_codon:yes gene_type:complete
MQHLIRKQNMKTTNYLTGLRRVRVLSGLIAIFAGASLLQADVFSDAISEGKVSIDIRGRYEYVDGPGSNDVNGYSIRTRLGFTTAEMDGFQASIELEDLSFADNDDRPGLDVPTTEINQLWIGYKNDSFSGKLGNQVYTLDDHRFIGHVGWRQNIQTFDAVTTQFAPTAETTVNLSYLSRVNRVNATAQDLEGFLLNGVYKVSEELSVTGFAYLLDFDSAGWAAMSTNTFGLRGEGAYSGYKYFLSYALQNDAGNNAANLDLSYLAGEVSTDLSGITLGLGFEALEGDGTNGFTTPLATVHKFNGFADVFAGRSIGLAGGLPQGLEDLYLKASYKLPVGNGLVLTTIYHEFNAENISQSLGSEIDVVGAYKLNDYTTLIGKYAYYDAESGVTVGYGASNASMFSLEANLKF